MSNRKRNESRASRDDSSDRRSLRVGLVYRGRVVDQAWVAPGEPVTIDDGAGDATLGFPSADAPDGKAMLRPKREGWAVRPSTCLDGRVVLPSRTVHLGRCAGDGRTDLGTAVPAEADVSGCMRLGELTLLFRTLEQPEEPETGEVSDRCEKGATDWVDETLMAAGLAAVVAVAGLFAWFEWTSWPTPEPDTQEVRVASFVDQKRVRRTGAALKRYETSETSEESSVDEQPNPKDEEPESTEPEQTSTEEPSSAEPSPEPSSTEATVAENDSTGASSGRDADATPGGVLEGLDEADVDVEKMDPDVDDAIAEGSPDADPSDGPEMETAAQHDGDGKTVGAAHEESSGGGRPSSDIGNRETGSAEDAEPSPPGHFYPEPTETSRQCLDRNSISRAVQQNKTSIRRCYTRYLKKNHEAAGKISVSVDVASSGTVQGVSITADSVGGSVAGCIRAKFRRMQLSSSCDSGAVEFEKSFVFSADR